MSDKEETKSICDEVCPNKFTEAVEKYCADCEYERKDVE